MSTIAKTKNNHIQSTRSEFWYTFTITAILILFGILTAVPLISELALSLSSKAASDMNAVTLWPIGFTFDSWTHMLSQSTLWRSFLISVASMVLGVAAALIINMLMAYPLAKDDFPLRKALMLYLIFTMIFKAPTVPYYLLVTGLGLRNNFLVLILPHILNAYNLIVMRSFFRAFPRDVEEAAEIDGCGKFGTLFRIVMPSSKPVLMTVGLYYGVTLWNQHQNPLMFITDPKLFPLQLRIQQIVSTGAEIEAVTKVANVNYTANTLSAVVVLFAVLPVLVVYPFIQKHFTKGAMVGSVKG
ncbi:MAG: carbohydrate ABC transporter permease [Clostridia bacterium]|nr:carbohydrate ABC transporter permease [Clostridia bacterium]